MGRIPDGSRSIPVFLSAATPAAANAVVAVSEFRILEATLLQNENILRLTWETEPGRAYAIQSSAELTADAWRDAGDPVIADGLSLTRDVSTSVAGGSRYFRIALVSE